MSERGPGLIYESDQWQVHLGRRELLARGVAVPIGARAFEIVEALVRSANELVTKDDLMGRIWPGAAIGENTLQVHVSAIRKAFGSDRGRLKTESGRGYRLIGNWTARPDIPRAEAREPEPPRLPEPRLPDGASPTNFPVLSSGLVGRNAAVQRLRDLLSAYRAVTLTGPGGIGKSALALEAARGLFPDFGGEGRLVELAALSDPELVPSTVVRVLGLRLSGDASSAEAVARAIGTKKTLLILDNCEHVIDAAATLAEAILRLCPHTTVLATSREILRIDGEHVYRVPPLDVPPQSQGDHRQLLGHSAAELFLARARALDADFLLDQGNAPAIAAICRSLDGIPLAIEFAAARAAMLGVQEVAAGLRDRFGLLTSGRRTALPRHQTLRATLDWSYLLLPPMEAAMLRRLAVFAGTFALEAVVALADVDEREVIDGITNLVAKSLIVADPHDGIGHYRMLEMTRLYALEKLRENGEYQRTSRRHAEYYLAVTARAEAESETRVEGEWLATYGRYLDNLRAALDWALSEYGDAEIGVALTAGVVPLWFKLSLMNECRARVHQALAGAGAQENPRVIMRLSAALAAASLYTVGATQEVSDAWTNVLLIADRLNDIEHRLWGRWGLWNFQLNHGAFREALPLARQFFDLAANPTDRAIGDRLIGISLHYLGEQAPARRHLENVLAGHADAAAGSMIRIQYDRKLAARAFLPRVLWLQGLPDQAMHAAESVVRDANAAGQALALCLALSPGACPVALLSGDLDAAERFVAMLHDRAVAHGLGFWRAEARCNEATLLVMRGDVAAGLRAFFPAVRELADYHTHMNVTGFLVVMAGALTETGEIAQGLALVDEALTRSEGDGELWCMPELLRIRGEFLLRGGTPKATAAAEAEFVRSLDLARRQGALSWELRTAVSFARLLRDTDHGADAERLLAPVYGKFREGFETADLLTAKQILETIV